MDCELVDCDQVSCKPLLGTCEPWYVNRFSGVDAVALYWQHNDRALRDAAVRFSRALYDTTLLPEVVEAVASNLSKLKSPRFFDRKTAACGDGKAPANPMVPAMVPERMCGTMPRPFHIFSPISSELYVKSNLAPTKMKKAMRTRSGQEWSKVDAIKLCSTANDGA
jgi:hypothetical protein